MKLNQNIYHNLHDIVNRCEKEILIRNIENLNFFYHNGNRMVHEIRWFKVSRNSGLKSDFTV